jgi:hypothetical protein
MRAALLETLMNGKKFKDWAVHDKETAEYELARDVNTYVGAYLRTPEAIKLFKQFGSQFPQYKWVVSPMIIRRNLLEHPESIQQLQYFWNSVNSQLMGHESEEKRTQLDPIGTTASVGRDIKDTMDPDKVNPVVGGVQDFVKDALVGNSSPFGIPGQIAGGIGLAAFKAANKQDPWSVVPGTLSPILQSFEPGGEGALAVQNIAASAAEKFVHQKKPLEWMQRKAKDVGGPYEAAADFHIGKNKVGRDAARTGDMVLEHLANLFTQYADHPQKENEEKFNLLDEMREAGLDMYGITSQKGVKNQ